MLHLFEKLAIINHNSKLSFAAGRAVRIFTVTTCGRRVEMRRWGTTTPVVKYLAEGCHTSASSNRHTNNLTTSSYYYVRLHTSVCWWVQVLNLRNSSKLQYLFSKGCHTEIEYSLVLSHACGVSVRLFASNISSIAERIFTKFRIGNFKTVSSVYSSDENGALDYQQDVSPTPETKTREPIVESIPIYHTEK